MTLRSEPNKPPNSSTDEAGETLVTSTVGSEQKTKTVGSGVDIGQPQDLYSLAIHLYATEVVFCEDSRVVFTIDRKSNPLKDFDREGDCFGALLDRIVPRRKEWRESYPNEGERLAIDHVLTRYDIISLFRAMSPDAEYRQFLKVKQCQFDYAGGSHKGSRWTISLVEGSGKLTMTWRFEFDSP
jgi:hypothetical protein